MKTPEEMTLQEVLDKYIGEKGTKAREDFENDLKRDIIEALTVKENKVNLFKG